MRCIHFILAFILVATIYSCTKDGFGTSNGIGFSGGPVSITPPTQFGAILENPFIKTSDSSVSTFSIDADGASYTTLRKIVNGRNDLQNYKTYFRTEEFLNYFTYNYPEPVNNESIGVNGEVSACPWNDAHKLIRIGIKGKSVDRAAYPAANFVLLIDVSGSMSSPDKLELLKQGFIDFANQMRPQDRIAIITYAGSERVVLNSTPGTQKTLILDKIRALGSGGGTNGEAGIKKAYEIAAANFITNGNNRVILGTDGDFNIGISDKNELVKLVKSKRDQGIFLTTLGVGDTYNDAMMEQIANKGNGNYEYLDSKEELHKVFVQEYNKFLTVAKDVKVQVTFNPEIVEQYRLIGYENRSLQASDFDNDAADAGEIGAGQTITALYEIKPKNNSTFRTDPSFTILFRYKHPSQSTSNLLTMDVYDEGHAFNQASENMRFASSLAALGLHVRNSDYKGKVTLADIKSWASGASLFDPNGYRQKHLQLLNKLN
jgi:Ca-activated chloride channel family protein